MRAEFNNSVDLYWGDTTASPGVLRESAVPCRIVPDEAFVDAVEPLSESEAYITMEEVEPMGPSWTETSPGIWEVDLGKGDGVTLHEAGIILWNVVRVERRTWPDGTNYWRAHVAPVVVEPIGCDSYGTSPWGIFLFRTSDSTWGDAETVLLTDGEGNWELTDVSDDLHYTVSGWDGHGTITLTQVENPEITVDLTCGDA